MVGFPKNGNSRSATTHHPRWFCLWDFSLNIALNMLHHRTPLLYLDYLLDLVIPQGNGRLCNWLSLWCLVRWINHVPVVCGSTFWKSSFKWKSVSKNDITKNKVFHCFSCVLRMYLRTNYIISVQAKRGVVRRKHIVYLTGFGADLSTCCKGTGNCAGTLGVD